ncbi:MAG: NUDIX hydrolase [Balneolaceae bacterium]
MSLEDYTGSLRVRSCGLLVNEEKLLLVEIQSPVNKQLTWMPPGGGVDFGESLQQALTREFKEETGLSISVDKLVHVNQLIQPPFHAIEFYFLVKSTGGKPALGRDPEHTERDQILRNLRYFSEPEIAALNVAPEYLKEKFWHQKREGFHSISILK